MAESRIVFPGSPWPGGHPVSSLVWSARLLPGPELWFDLHLCSADYETTPEDDDEDESAWSSPGVWGNYHRCTISSTQWGHRGFRAGTPDQPLHLAQLSGRTFEVDHDADRIHPESREPDRDYLLGFAFGGYVLGHATVAAHRVRFSRRHDGDAFDLEWHGRVSARLGLAHDHTFRVTAAGLRLAHVDVAPGLPPGDAVRVLGQVLAEGDDYASPDGDDRRLSYRPR